MSDLDIIKKIPIFSGLGPEELTEVQNIYLTGKYEKGNILFFEGEPGEAVYFVKSGKIKVYKSDAEGREYILHILDRAIFLPKRCFLKEGHTLQVAKPLRILLWE